MMDNLDTNDDNNDSDYVDDLFYRIKITQGRSNRDNRTMILNHIVQFIKYRIEPWVQHKFLATNKYYLIIGLCFAYRNEKRK